MSDVSRSDARSIDKQIDLDGELAGGVLPEDLFDEFYELVQNESVLLDEVRTVDLPRPQMKIPRIGVGERMIRESGERVDNSETEDVTTDTVPMSVTKIDLKWSLPQEAVEDTIDDVPDIVMEQMSQQFAVDTEELALKGDEAESDPFIGIEDGWFTLASARGAPTYSLADSNGNPQPVSPEKLNEAMRALEPKYLRDEPAFLVNTHHVNQYFGELVDREDGLGVAVIRGEEEHNPFGHDIIASPVFPLDKAMFTTTDNLIYGLHRDVEVDVLDESDEVFDKDLFAKYAIRARLDFQIEDENAALVMTDIEDPTINA
ncbi:phage major capsid protein [Halorubrum sp. C191]|uniref:phage major capsid protein n=1 Tax=Halorubrum sp. C191 TaxID=1383842 RepID=UPI000C06BD8A|nr:phage major capsid protein [Halorubrum sp. C191]PHQ43940.1 phage major capsid protein [Halorubrum sp. C191]